MSQTTSNGTGALFLCLDTSTPTARVAILDGDLQSPEGIRFAAEATAERHAGHLLPLCVEALRAVGVAPAALAGIACGGGPGSFTGLRVGLSVAKGLAMPTGVPLHVVSSLEALALDILGMPRNGAAPSITAVPCLDAGKGEVYVAAYIIDSERLVREVMPSARLTPAAFGSWASALDRPVVAGNGAARHREALSAAEIVDVAGPSAVSVGRLALLQRARGEASDLATAVPFYGRPPDITVKKQV
jgi:tRNA threonylcarbamoyladenosine biosynthesis protein TsaB